MKKIVCLVWLCLLLVGCGAEETFETISDDLVVSAMAQPAATTLSLPGETALPVMESDNGRIYLSRDYEIMVQTLPGGDLQATIQTISGREPEDLTVMETHRDGVSRHEFVWAAAGETGERVGRGLILDDGCYHYCLSAMWDTAGTEKSQISWDQVFDSFSLSLY